MAIVHTISQAFIVKEDFDEIHKLIADSDVLYIMLNKLSRAGSTYEGPPKYVPIVIVVDMIVAVEDKPQP